MIGLAVFLLTTVAAVPEGQVTATTGVVRIERAGQVLSARIRSGFEPGDRLTTGPRAGAGLFLYNGQSVYVGPDAALLLPATGDSMVQLERGELRATVDSPKGLTITAGEHRVQVQRGTVWAAVNPTGTRFRAEHGSALVSTGQQAPITLAADQEATISPTGTLSGPTPATPTNWTLGVSQLQLLGAAAESRRGKSGQVELANEQAASEFASTQIPGGLGPDRTSTDSTANPPGTPPPPGENNQPGTTPQPDTSTQASANDNYQPAALSQTNTSFASVAGSLALSGASGAFSFAGSGGLGNDAQQDSRDPAFPGNIYLVTALSRYSLDSVRLKKDDIFPTGREYFSIGVGEPPTGRVQTNFQTGTGAVPQSIRIPHFNAYVLELSQFNISDPATAPSNTALTGISGLLGAHPISPQIQGATPLLDSRASFNDRATFALGEFALQRDPNRPRTPQFEIRRSDQDRLIVPGTGPADPVLPNPQIFPRYSNVVDSKFFPDFPQGVKVPDRDGFRPAPTLTKLDLLRKAAITTLLADKLIDYSHRTGQTQFVVDGQIIDTAGYSRNLQSPRPTPRTSARAAALAGAGPRSVPRAGVAQRSPGGADLVARAAASRGAGTGGAPGLRSFGPRPEASRTGAAAHVAAMQRQGGRR